MRVLEWAGRADPHDAGGMRAMAPLRLRDKTDLVPAFLLERDGPRALHAILGREVRP